MTELTDTIMSEIESDPGIDAKSISLAIQSQGLFKKRKILRINGIVDSPKEKDLILQIVRKQAGNRYDIANKLVVG